VIWAVVLAAGASTRMGEPKALLRGRNGGSFVHNIADSARSGGCGGVLVVVGPPHGDAIRRALPAGVGTTANARPERGMLSSVQAGLQALPAAATAALVWPVDVPLVEPASVRAILAAAPGKIIVPTHNNHGGHPLRLPRRLFGAVAALDPDVGLRALLQSHAAEVVRLALPDPHLLVDVDTRADYTRSYG
jgi:molybdenum cofactor cytidylyltransferase